jgi:hypothetical protein|tara:strand:- start:330 stop:554 length:225 start_codon:yes stop_codon:yes gene_type:complete
MSYKSSVTMAELKEAQAIYKKLQLLQKENAERIEKLEQLFEDLDTGAVAIKVPVTPQVPALNGMTPLGLTPSLR